MKFVSFRMSLVINFMTKCISISLTIFQHQKPFRIKSLDQRILFSKLFSKSFIKHENKVSVSIWNGDFKILRPECYFWESDFLEILQGKSKQKSLHNIVQRCLNDMTIVCKPLLKHIYHYKEETKLYPNNSKLIEKSIYRYIIKSSIQPAFDISYGSGKYETMQWLTKEENYYTNSMVTTIVTDLSQFHSHLLYITPKVPLNQLPALYVKDYFYTSDEEVNSLKLKALPPANRANFSLGAKYVYNIIEINEVIPMNFKKVSVGGFSEISIAQIQFWYLMTVSGKRMAKVDELKKDNHSIPEQRSKKINKKILVFKSNSYKGAESGRNRVLHEMKIVSKFKGTPSIFFPQYFKTVNTKALFSQYLIMEYLPYLTLNQYTELNKFTSSFLTKVHLASMIVHSLHLLKNHGIVHMDLKPSNIIVSKRMIPKILDFGQSFCKDVCDKNFRPAFSMPYGCPEIFDGIGRADFNQKNDVYSLGIILFELLFKRTPFVFTQQKASRIFKQREYFKYIYFVPEEEDKYGEFQIISLVRNVIFRCLDVNIKNRPYTIWLTIILKEFWTHLINLQLNPLVS